MREYRALRATTVLPPGYSPAVAIDLAAQPVLALLLSVAGLVAFALVALVLWVFLRAVRPDATTVVPWPGLVEFVAVTVAVVVVHEALHGVCFRLLAGAMPRFGLRLLYAYASAPGWYVPRSRYLAVGLAPLIVIGVIGLALLVLVDGTALALAGVAVAINSGGSVGDLAIVALVLREPRDSLVLDSGPAVTVFRRTGR